MFKSALILFCLQTATLSNAANVLVFDGMASPSHQMWTRVLVNAIAVNKQHNITVVSLQSDPAAPENVHYILLENVYDAIYDGSAVTDWVAVSQVSVYEEIQQCTEYCLLSCNATIRTNGFQQILNYPTNFKFDLLLNDYTCGPCLLGILHRFNHQPTIVGITASSILVPEVSGGHNQYAYIPHFLLPYDSDMNFYQRIQNFIVYHLAMAERHFNQIPLTTELLESVLHRKLPKSLENIERETKLTLINSEVTVDYPQPLPPNVIQVGGLQIRDPKVLPTDIEDFIVGSIKGTILFSFGTNVECDGLPQKKRDAILGTFKELSNYNFLWKCNSKDIPKHPARNVLVQSYFPQNDILAHPKVKAFVTHSGIMSTQEATWYGVPLLGVPFIRDQPNNIKKSVKAGVAELLYYADLTKETLKEKILLVLENPKYRENMRLRSMQFRDQAQKPLERAVWWIERVLRNPKLDYMQSPVFQLGYINGNSYDVMSIIIALPLVLIAVTIFIIWKLISCLCRRSNNRKVKKR